MIDSVFTTARVDNFYPVWFAEHLLRLKEASLRLSFNYDFSDAERKISDFLVKENFKNGRLRIVLDRTTGLRMILSDLPYKTEKYAAKIRETDSPLGEYKKFPSVAEAVYPGEETVLVDSSSGNVLEGSYNNIFINIDDSFFTPKADGRIINGICRRKFIHYLKLRKIPVFEKDISADFLLKGDLYFTNALRGVVKGVLF